MINITTLALLLTLVPAPTIAIQGSQTGAPPIQAAPPDPLYWATGVRLFGRTIDSEGQVYCLLSARTDTRRVKVDWSWTPNFPVSDPVVQEPGSFTAPFWPTATGGSTGPQAYIAGVGLADHKPLIQSWLFAPSTRSIVNGTAGPIYNFQAGRRVSTNAVWSSQDDAEIISLISSLPSTNGNEKLAVFFPLKKRLSILDVASGAMTDIAVASTATGGGLHIPGLRNDYTGLKVMDHVTMGYMYVLTKRLSSDVTMVVLDQNRDGSIDAGVDHFVLADEQVWGTMGWGNPASFIKH